VGLIWSFARSLSASYYPLKIRISAFAPIDWGEFQYVSVYQGDPDNGGILVKYAEIPGVDRDKGGDAWFTWYAPGQPGEYVPTARLLERADGENPGNHMGRLRVTVAAVP
jgi:hypothetical protein